MSWLPTSTAAGALKPGVARRVGSASPWTRFVEWAAAARSHRVILLVLGIWVLNAFDLTLTVLAHQQGMLHEENPVARGILAQGTSSIMLYKLGLVLIGSYPLLRFRAVRVTEMGAMLVLIAYAWLAVRWSWCYELYMLTAADHVSLRELEALRAGFP